VARVRVANRRRSSRRAAATEARRRRSRRVVLRVDRCVHGHWRRGRLRRLGRAPRRRGGVRRFRKRISTRRRGDFRIVAAVRGRRTRTVRSRRGYLHVAAGGGGGTSSSSGWPFYGRDLANSRNGGRAGPAPAAASSLAEKWRFTSQDGDFTGTPVVSQGTVIAVSGGGTVFALDARTGRLKWARDLIPDASENKDRYSVNGSAAIAGGRVYVPVAKVDNPRLYALALEDGSRLWNAPLDSQHDADVFSSPVVWGETVYMGTSALFGELNDPDVHVRGSLVGLDAVTGARRWKTYTVPPGRDGGSIWSTPAIDTATGRLFVGTGNAYHAPAVSTTDSIVAFDARSGRILDHFQATPDDVWTGTTGAASGPDADFGASPNLMTGPGGRKLVGEGDKSSTYWTVDRRTLDPVWHRNLGPGSFVGGILGSTAWDGANVYGPMTQGGQIWSLGRDGSVRWRSADGDALHFASTTTANGVVYSADFNGFLNVRNASTGTPLTKLPLNQPAFGGVAVTDGRVFAVTGTQDNSTGNVVAFGAG
jgi:polyvinyl alcohol dehydrogenase (cytochrome)